MKYISGKCFSKLIFVYRVFLKFLETDVVQVKSDGYFNFGKSFSEYIFGKYFSKLIFVYEVFLEFLESDVVQVKSDGVQEVFASIQGRISLANNKNEINTLTQVY